MLSGVGVMWRTSVGRYCIDCIYSGVGGVHIMIV